MPGVNVIELCARVIARGTPAAMTVVGAALAGEVPEPTPIATPAALLRAVADGRAPATGADSIRRCATGATGAAGSTARHSGAREPVMERRTTGPRAAEAALVANERARTPTGTVEGVAAAAVQTGAPAPAAGAVPTWAAPALVAVVAPAGAAPALACTAGAAPTGALSISRPADDATGAGGWANPVMDRCTTGPRVAGPGADSPSWAGSVAFIEAWPPAGADPPTRTADGAASVPKNRRTTTPGRWAAGGAPAAPTGTAESEPGATAPPAADDAATSRAGDAAPATADPIPFPPGTCAGRRR